MIVFLYLVRCDILDEAVFSVLFIALARLFHVATILEGGIGVHLKLKKDRERECMQLTVPMMTAMQYWN